MTRALAGRPWCQTFGGNALLLHCTMSLPAWAQQTEGLLTGTPGLHHVADCEESTLIQALTLETQYLVALELSVCKSAEPQKEGAGQVREGNRSSRLHTCTRLSLGSSGHGTGGQTQGWQEEWELVFILLTVRVRGAWVDSNILEPRSIWTKTPTSAQEITLM